MYGFSTEIDQINKRVWMGRTAVPVETRRSKCLCPTPRGGYFSLGLGSGIMARVALSIPESTKK